jgi:hypothetical protein
MDEEGEWMKIRLNLTTSDDNGHVFAKDVDVVIADDLAALLGAQTLENATCLLLDRMSSGSGIDVFGIALR